MKFIPDYAGIMFLMKLLSRSHIVFTYIVYIYQSFEMKFIFIS